MIDLKYTTGDNYIKLPHLALPVAFEPVDAEECLSFALSELGRRKRAVKEGIKAKSHPRLLVVIDELTELASSADVNNSLATLARMGAGFNITFLSATQYPTAKEISAQFLRNMQTRLSFVQDDAQASRIALGITGAEKLERFKAIARINGEKPFFVRFPHIDEDRGDVKKFVEKRIKKWGGHWEYLESISEKKNIIDTLDEEMKRYLDSILKYESPGLKIGMNRINEIVKSEFGNGIGNSKQRLLQQAVLES